MHHGGVGLDHVGDHARAPKNLMSQEYMMVESGVYDDDGARVLPRARRSHVIPYFYAKTKYSSYVCPGSIIPHIRIESVHR
jgi:hypothetical protein